MAKAIAIVVTDLERNRLGGPSHAARELAGRPVLAHTAARAANIEQVDRVVVVCPKGQEEAASALLGKTEAVVFGHEDGIDDPFTPMRRAARKWAIGSWRGGLGGATCYDELLGSKAIAAAMKEHAADAAVLLGGDWPLHDPALSSAVLELHLKHPQAMQMVFNQSPPGLSGIVVGRELAEQFAATPGSGIGALMAYHPRRPQADPIGKDFCIQIPPQVRNCGRRFIYDIACARRLLEAVAAELGAKLDDADAASLVAAVAKIDENQPDEVRGLPRQVSLELTPRRLASGPLVPQSFVRLDRPDMPTETALRVIEQLEELPGALLTLGGLGDALLHEGWAEVVSAAAEAGILGICIETDLLVEQDVLAKLLDLPVDVVSVRLNADNAATYAKVMGCQRFEEVHRNVVWLLNERNRRAGEGKGRMGVPWIVPRLVKTPDTLADVEGFFDRWTYFAGWAVIEGPPPGRGPSGDLRPDVSVLQMAPPRRRPCRQLARRITIHSDGQVALCDQDWLGTSPVGDVSALPQTLKQLHAAAAKHDAGQWDQLPLCGGCREWHRP